MRIKEHRIYQYMSEPVRILGMTIDEVLILLGSFFCFLWVESVSIKLAFLISGSLGVYLIKRFKKLTTGFSLTSYLHWHLGIRGEMTRHWPESWKRTWLP